MKKKLQKAFYLMPFLLCKKIAQMQTVPKYYFHPLLKNK